MGLRSTKWDENLPVEGPDDPVPFPNTCHPLRSFYVVAQRNRRRPSKPLIRNRLVGQPILAAKIGCDRLSAGSLHLRTHRFLAARDAPEGIVHRPSLV
jgi:hypothetical protein